MTDFTIRPATVKDVSILVRHRRMMWWDMGRRDETALDLMEKGAREYFSSAVRDGSYRGFLAVNEDGKVIGGAGVVISAWPGVLGQRQPKRAMVLNMYVEREYRRRGIARELMKTMIAWCKGNGFRRVGLHASDEGRPLYESLGFTATNEMQLDFD
jgi:GNAT superfamily N-acetyltransferase